MSCFFLPTVFPFLIQIPAFISSFHLQQILSHSLYSFFFMLFVIQKDFLGRCVLQTCHSQAQKCSRFSFSVCSEKGYTTPVLSDFWICPGWLHTFENNQHLVKSILWVQFQMWDIVYDYSSIWTEKLMY